MVGDNAYHDDVWGTPVHDSKELFTVLSLVSQQGTLNWWCVWSKRDAYARVFHNFELRKVARMTDIDVDGVYGDQGNGVIHHRGKLLALRDNARVFERIEDQHPGGLAGYLWSFVPRKSPLCRPFPYSPRNPYMRGTLWAMDGGSCVSVALATELKQQGLSHIGPTLFQSFLLQVGILNGHEPGCWKNRRRAARRDEKDRIVREAKACLRDRAAPFSDQQSAQSSSAGRKMRGQVKTLQANVSPIAVRKRPAGRISGVSA